MPITFAKPQRQAPPIRSLSRGLVSLSQGIHTTGLPNEFYVEDSTEPGAFLRYCCSFDASPGPILVRKNHFQESFSKLFELAWANAADRHHLIKSRRTFARDIV